MKNYLRNMAVFTCAPFTQLALMIGGAAFGNLHATTWDWALGCVMPFYGWYFILFG